MDKTQRSVSAVFASIRSLWNRWEFQHDQGQEGIIEIANICRKLLKPIDLCEKEELLAFLQEKWSGVQKNLTRLQRIYEKIKEERDILVGFQDSEDIVHSGKNVPVFVGITLAQYGG